MIVTHDTPLVAVHGQPASVVTVMEPVPPEAAYEEPDGRIDTSKQVGTVDGGCVP